MVICIYDDGRTIRINNLIAVPLNSVRISLQRAILTEKVT